MEDLTFTVKPIKSLDELEKAWRELEKVACPPIFLSWLWIGTWLKTVRPTFKVLIVRDAKVIVAMGVLVEKSTLRNGFVFSKQIFLNKSGVQKQDQMWIEYNDFLIHPDYDSWLRVPIIQELEKQIDFDELHIGVSSKKTITQCDTGTLHQINSWNSTNYSVDLDKIRKNPKSFIDQLSSNTRQQLRSNLKSYGARGELRISIADSKKQALEWLSELSTIHQNRWGSTALGSGFSNPTFVEFHQLLLNDHIETGKVELLKITYGKQLVAFLYNFIEQDNVRFYLSAIQYEKENKFKPGLLAHYLAIEHYLKQDKKMYDFMAGDSRYKHSFATQSVPVYQSVFQKQKLKFKIENNLKQLKKRFINHHLISGKGLYKEISLILSGESYDPESRNNVATAIKLNIDKVGQVKESKLLRHHTSEEHGGRVGKGTFKSGVRYNNEIYLTTETEVVKTQVDLDSSKTIISHPLFNDVHHVLRRKNGNLAVVSTGIDAVLEFDSHNKLVSRWSTNNTPIENRLTETVDYRFVKSTKPHLTHPNFCFEVNSKLWVTRCDTMDAICLEEPKLRMDVGNGLCHDGIVFNKQVYFSTTNGFLRVFDTRDFTLSHSVDLKNIIHQNNELGWCRGILPLNKALIIIGFTKRRNSKRGSLLNSNRGSSEIVCIDIVAKQLKWRIDVGALGLETIFSILPGEKR